jgi:hypothetical protein
LILELAISSITIRLQEHSASRHVLVIERIGHERDLPLSLLPEVIIQRAEAQAIAGDLPNMHRLAHKIIYGRDDRCWHLRRVQQAQ